MRRILLSFLFVIPILLFSQTKAGGIVVDEEGEPVAFANVVFKGSTQGTITNEDGLFYLESDETFEALLISFIGYQKEELPLNKAVNYDLEVILVQGEQLDEVIVYVGKQSKKNNPAIDILKRIWAKKRINGLRQFEQYQYDKYEKVEFDLNSIDSAMMKSKLFKGMEFVFQDLDTSRISGKTYLPIFLNETFTKVYGDNNLNQTREDVLGNKNSGFSNNQAIIGFVKDLYNEYDVYDNYLKFFDKSFPSPLGKPGIDAYNYVLSDSAFI
ncbi:carboxypeptidase-like regulatory domain-containing protein, partial [Eudoraea sp.]